MKEKNEEGIDKQKYKIEVFSIFERYLEKPVDEIWKYVNLLIN